MNITNPIASIESKLFNVVEHQLIPNTNDGNFENPTVRGLYKHTGGKPLGVVGANFNATQPKVLFDAYVDCIGEIRDLDINQLDYQETKEGSKIRFRLKVANYGFRNGSGRMDDLDTYITLTSGYDGLTKTSLAVESYRLICSNGMKVVGTTKVLGIKNVKGNAGKIESICNEMATVIGKAKGVEDYFKFLDGINVDELTVQKVIKQSFGFNRKDAEISKARLTTLDEIESSIALEISRSGGNLWGLLNGITHFTNHGGRKKSDLVDYVYQAGGATINDRAQKSILELSK